MNAQDNLRQLVKIKGVGKTMSKSLDSTQLATCTKLLLDPSAHMATKTTLLVAFFMLSHTNDEQMWFTNLKSNYKSLVPKECYFLFDQSLQTNNSQLIKIIHKVLSKHDLNQEDLHYSCEAILSPTINSYYKSALLEALRLKEESKEENAYFLTYFYNKCTHHKLEIPILIDLATAYDGFNRHPNLLLGLAVLLSSIEFPTIIHGCKHVSPKFGLTFNKALDLAGKDPYLSINTIQSKLENPSIRWAYIDQKIHFPEFHDLVECRTALVKRPILATIEKFMQPIIADSTYLVTGYTHPAYRQKTIDLLKHLPNCTDFLFVRGIEGSALPPIDRRCPLIYTTHSQQHITEGFSAPEDYNFEKNNDFEPNKTITINESNTFLLDGLTSSESLAGKWLIYSALTILSRLNLCDDFNETHLKLKHSIDSKKALAHWQAY